MNTSINGTALMTSDNGTSLGTMKYYPYGATRSGSVPTDKLFTGQRKDGTGLYYYGARYYDPMIGRFISADTVVPNPANPQSFNRFSYCMNNPLKYTDPSGNIVEINGWDVQMLDKALELGDYMMLLNIAPVVISPEFQAYSAFRSSSTKATIMAESMERDSAHQIIIESDSDSDISHWAETVPNGNDFTITLRAEMFQPYGLERWKQGNVIYEQVDSHILDTHPNYDYWSAVISGGKNAIPGGKGVQVAKGLLTGVEAYYQVEKIHQKSWPEAIIDTVFGSIPVVGPLYGFFGELIRQQNYYDMMVAYYNESGDPRGYYSFR
jgi:RHS repeat-associated protein